MSRGISPLTRQTVLGRDQDRCQRCGRHVAMFGYSLQHRRPKGMGGSSLSWINLPGNLVTLCGSATTPDGCHLWAESERTEAEEAGYVVRHPTDPRTVPVATFHGLVLFDDDGGFTVVDPERAA